MLFRTGKSKVYFRRLQILVPSKVSKRVEIRHPWCADGVKAIFTSRSLLQQKNNIVFMSGAGISVNADIKSSSLLRFLI